MQRVIKISGPYEHIAISVGNNNIPHTRPGYFKRAFYFVMRLRLVLIFDFDFYFPSYIFTLALYIYFLYPVLFLFITCCYWSRFTRHPELSFCLLPNLQPGCLIFALQPQCATQRCSMAIQQPGSKTLLLHFKVRDKIDDCMVEFVNIAKQETVLNRQHKKASVVTHPEFY